MIDTTQSQHICIYADDRFKCFNVLLFLKLNDPDKFYFIYIEIISEETCV